MAGLDRHLIILQRRASFLQDLSRPQISRSQTKPYERDATSPFLRLFRSLLVRIWRDSRVHLELRPGTVKDPVHINENTIKTVYMLFL